MHITVATYNAGLLKIGPQDGVPLAQRRSLLFPKIVFQTALEHQVDIFCFQEVWQSRDTEELSQELAKAGYQCIRPKLRFLLSSGLVIAVRPGIEILSFDFTPFKRACSWDRFVRKGMLRMRLQKVGFPQFEVFGLHFQALSATVKDWNASVQVEVFESQVSQLVNLLCGSDVSSSPPSLILGDLNVGPQCRPKLFSDLQKKLGAEDIFISPNEQIVAGHTWVKDNPLVANGFLSEEPSDRLDHCLTRNTLDWNWVIHQAFIALELPLLDLSYQGIPVPLSDHYAIIARVELVPSVAQLKNKVPARALA